MKAKKRPGQLTDAEFMALADRAVDDAEAQGEKFLTLAEFERLAREAAALASANNHLRAYLVDRNPEHVFNAFREYVKYEVPLPAVMVKNLDKAIGERGKPKARAPAPASTLRDVLILRRLFIEYGRIPEKLPPRTLQAIAQAHGMTANAASVAVHRLRRLLADSQYNRRSRAFR